MNDFVWVSGGQLLASTGSVSTPACSFYNDRDTGIYMPTTGELGFTTAGSIELLITNTYARFYDDLYADQGIYVGRQVAPGAGNVAYTGALKSYKNSTEYTGYITVPMTSAGTHTSWDGESKGVGVYDIPISYFGVPSGAKIIKVRVTAKYNSIGGGFVQLENRAYSTYGPIIIRAGNTQYQDETGDVPLSDDYLRVRVSGQTLDAFWIIVWGYSI